MSVNAATAVTDVYASYASGTNTTDKTKQKESSTASGTNEVKDTQAAEETGAVYEKSEEKTDKATYSVHKMSAEDRASLVEQLKADQENRQQQLVDLVQKMMSEQATTYGKATDMWKFLASGNYTVDAQTKAQAQADIAEDGYYGVKQTSQRLFDFASALAGDDVEKMKEMQKAMEKGFKQATGAWGKELPGICKETMNAANKLFDDYYASKEKTETAEE